MKKMRLDEFIKPTAVFVVGPVATILSIIYVMATCLNLIDDSYVVWQSESDFIIFNIIMVASIGLLVVSNIYSLKTAGIISSLEFKNHNYKNLLKGTVFLTVSSILTIIAFIIEGYEEDMVLPLISSTISTILLIWSLIVSSPGIFEDIKIRNDQKRMDRLINLSTGTIDDLKEIISENGSVRDIRIKIDELVSKPNEGRVLIPTNVLNPLISILMENNSNEYVDKLYNSEYSTQEDVKGSVLKHLTNRANKIVNEIDQGINNKCEVKELEQKIDELVSKPNEGRVLIPTNVLNPLISILMENNSNEYVDKLYNSEYSTKKEVNDSIAQFAIIKTIGYDKIQDFNNMCDQVGLSKLKTKRLYITGATVAIEQMIKSSEEVPTDICKYLTEIINNNEVNKCFPEALLAHINSMKSNKKDYANAAYLSVLESKSFLSDLEFTRTLIHISMAAYSCKGLLKHEQLLRLLELNREYNNQITSTTIDEDVCNYLNLCVGINYYASEELSESKKYLETVIKSKSQISDIAELYAYEIKRWDGEIRSKDVIEKGSQVILNHESDPAGLAIIHHLYAKIYSDEGMYRKAIEELKEAYTNNHTSKEYILELFRQYAKLSDFDKIRETIDELVGIKEYAEICDLMAAYVMMYGKGDYRSARNILTPHRSSTNVLIKASTSYMIGIIQHKLALYNDASDEFNKCIEILNTPKTYEEHILLCKSYYSLAESMYSRGEAIHTILPNLEKALELIDHLRETFETESLRKDILATEDAIRDSETKKDSSKTKKTIGHAVFRDMIVNDLVGSGSKYSVYDVTKDNIHYALKVPQNIDILSSKKTTKITPAEVEEYQHEISIWEDLSSNIPDKVVILKGTGAVPHIWILCELGEYTYEDKVTNMPISMRLDALTDLFKALKSMHELGYIHNDIKPSNLISINGHWKLNDFDSSAYVDENRKITAGTFEYMPPEYFTNSQITIKSDIWSAGVMLYESISNRLPFEGSGEEYNKNVIDGKFNKDAIQEKYVDLFSKIFSINPEDRPDSNEIVEILESIKNGRN